MSEPKRSRGRLGGIVVFSAAAFLLLTMGGAIAAAPLTVPLLFLVMRRRPTTAFRIIGCVLAGATVAEVVWALAYLTVGESAPWIWLLPVAAAVATITAACTTSPIASAMRTGSPGPRRAA
jgi:hypothetical protein